MGTLLLPAGQLTSLTDTWVGSQCMFGFCQFVQNSRITQVRVQRLPDWGVQLFGLSVCLTSWWTVQLFRLIISGDIYTFIYLLLKGGRVCSFLGKSRVIIAVCFAWPLRDFVDLTVLLLSMTSAIPHPPHPCASLHLPTCWSSPFIYQFEVFRTPMAVLTIPACLDKCVASDKQW